MNEQDFIGINSEKLSCITSITNLPTAKEYREAAQKDPLQWSEPKYQCPKCGGGMRRNEMVVLTSYPPQYEYQCDKCGYIEYQYK